MKPIDVDAVVRAARETGVVVTAEEYQIGALAWRPDALSRKVATAVSAQVAIALTRSLAIETYTHMEAAREGDRLRTALPRLQARLKVNW